MLKCEFKDGCPHPVTHLDPKGFIYCTMHAVIRKAYCRCRKLTPAELKRLQAGTPIARY